MTVEGRDALMVYDPDTGHFTQSLAPVRGELHEELKSYWSTHELNEILQRLRQKPIVEPRDLNGRSEFDEPHICVENGVLNLFESELKDHSPEYRFVDRVPQTFDPDASTEPYEEFLNDVTAREADWKAMMEMAGHALVPDANERYKKFLILTGDSDNGKSVFFSRVKELLEGVDGEENNVMSVKLSKIASQRFSKKAVYGSMANVAGEIDGKKIRNTADLKDITGGDEQEIEPKGGESFSDTINSTLMFAANDPPIIGERDKSAIATRIVPVELPYQFVEDPDGPMQKQRRPERELEDELCTDEAMSGFLNLALDGIQRLEENHGDVSLPEPPMERLKKYEKAADPMKEFAAECLANEDGEYVAKADVTSIYKEFAADNDYETGSNIHSVLHGVLQGTKELNYTTSRPEPADYASTSLPLRPWSERKRVLDRVTLTEKGLEYAEMAGLLVDATEADGEDKDYIPLSELTETRKQFVTLEATAVTVRPGRGENGPEGNVVLDDGEEMAEVTFWESHPSEYGVEEGGEYRIEGLKLNYQGQQISLQSVDGVTEAVPLGEVPSDGPSPGGDGEQSSLSDADAAADGGETIPEDAEGAEANAKRIANYLAREGEAKSRASLAGHFNGKMDSDEFDAAMDKAVTKGLIVHAGADDYEANR
jgi:putative DNA primase/helicase